MDERTTAAKSARSVFFESYNDVDVYIEDTAVGYRKIYKEIFNRIFENKLKVEHFLPLGGSDAVIEECRRNQEPSSRKRVYIIDGDLFLINRCERKTDGLNGLFILPRYCIENYLIDENAFVEILYRIDPERERDAIRSSLNFQNWIKDNEQTITDLFIIYALCKKHGIDETVSYKIYKLSKKGVHGDICAAKTETRKNQLIAQLIAKIGEQNFNNEIIEIKERMKSEDNTMLRFASGKDCLFPLLVEKFKIITSSNIYNISLKLHLASLCNIEELRNVEKYIII